MAHNDKRDALVLAFILGSVAGLVATFVADLQPLGLIAAGLVLLVSAPIYSVALIAALYYATNHYPGLYTRSFPIGGICLGYLWIAFKIYKNSEAKAKFTEAEAMAELDKPRTNSNTPAARSNKKQRPETSKKDENPLDALRDLDRECRQPIQEVLRGTGTNISVAKIIMADTGKILARIASGRSQALDGLTELFSEITICVELEQENSYEDEDFSLGIDNEAMLRWYSGEAHEQIELPHLVSLLRRYDDEHDTHLASKAASAYLAFAKTARTRCGAIPGATADATLAYQEYVALFQPYIATSKAQGAPKDDGGFAAYTRKEQELQQERLIKDYAELIALVKSLVVAGGSQVMEIMRVGKALHGTALALDELIFADVLQILARLAEASARLEEAARMLAAVRIETAPTSVSGYNATRAAEKLRSVDLSKGLATPLFVDGLTLYDRQEGTQLASRAAQTYLQIVAFASMRLGDSVASRILVGRYRELLEPYISSTQDSRTNATDTQKHNGGCQECETSYRTLDLPFGSKNEEVRAKRRAFAEFLHPDQLASKSERARRAAEEQLKSINAACDHILKCRAAQ